MLLVAIEGSRVLLLVYIYSIIIWYDASGSMIVVVVIIVVI